MLISPDVMLEVGSGGIITADFCFFSHMHLAKIVACWVDGQKRTVEACAGASNLREQVHFFWPQFSHPDVYFILHN